MASGSEVVDKRCVYCEKAICRTYLRAAWRNASAEGSNELLMRLEIRDQYASQVKPPLQCGGVGRGLLQCRAKQGRWGETGERADCRKVVSGTAAQRRVVRCGRE